MNLNINFLRSGFQFKNNEYLTKLPKNNNVRINYLCKSQSFNECYKKYLDLNKNNKNIKINKNIKN